MSPALLFFLVACGLSLTMATAWFAVTRDAQAGWVDAIWSFAVGAAGVAAALVPIEGWQGDESRRIIVALLAALWSLRLGLHIAVRTRGAGQDPRYAALFEEWAGDWRRQLFRFLQIQAAAALVLSATVFLAARNPVSTLQWSDFAGIAILVLAIIGEGVSDAQLSRFRADPRNRGKVCANGLWGVSRHPNYFFQWLGWIGYSVIAVGPDGSWPLGWASFAGPALMYVLLVHVSGIPPLEAHMLRSRAAAFATYQKRVNAFWPGRQHPEALI